MNKNDTWAIRCHGWMHLSNSQFKQINRVVKIGSYSRWVIVKKYAPSPTRPSHIQAIFDNFSIPKEARMIPGDVRVENYRGSQLVDLGQTQTYPHPEWSNFHHNWFYEKTVHGVKYWEIDGKISETSSDNSAFVSTWVFCACLFSSISIACFVASQALSLDLLTALIARS